MKKDKSVLDKDGHLKEEVYDKHMSKLQVELVKLQEWIKLKGLKVVVIFEGTRCCR